MAAIAISRAGSPDAKHVVAIPPVPTENDPNGIDPTAVSSVLLNGRRAAHASRKSDRNPNNGGVIQVFILPYIRDGATSGDGTQFKNRRQSSAFFNWRGGVKKIPFPEYLVVVSHVIGLRFRLRGVTEIASERAQENESKQVRNALSSDLATLKGMLVRLGPTIRFAKGHPSIRSVIQEPMPADAADSTVPHITSTIVNVVDQFFSVD